MLETMIFWVISFVFMLSASRVSSNTAPRTQFENMSHGCDPASAYRYSSHDWTLSKESSETVVGSTLAWFERDVILSCQWKNVVIISDQFYPSLQLNAVLDIARMKNLLVSHFSISEEHDRFHFEMLFRDCYYSDQKLINFLLMSRRSTEFISAAQEVFYQEGMGTLMPSRVQFVILTNTTEFNDLADYFDRSVFDNVAVIVLDNNDSTGSGDCGSGGGHTAIAGTGAGAVRSIQTLRWRESRQREMETVSTNYNVVTGACDIFPNTKLGFNGRSVICLAKQWDGEVYIKPDPITGKAKYVGPLLDILNIVGQKLNFTLALYQQPELDANITWSDVTRMVSDKVVELSVPLWSQNLQYSYNLSVTFPIREDIISAAYVRTYSSDPWNSPLVSTFSTLVLVTLFCSLIGIAFIYTFLINESPNQDKEQSSMFKCIELNNIVTETDNLQPPDLNLRRMVSADPGHQNEITETIIRNNALDIKTPQDVTESQSSISDRKECEARRCKTEYITDFIVLIVKLILSLIKVDIISIPRLLSARLLLWTWLILVLVFTAVFSGTLTAQSIYKTPPALVSTIDQLSRSDYNWYTPQPFLSFIAAMKKASPSSTLGRLYAGMPYLRSSEPDIVFTEQLLLEKMIKEKNFFAIMSRSTIERFANEHIAEDIVIIDDNVMSGLRGIIVPRDAEIEKIISENFMLLVESGLIKTIFETWTSIQSTSLDSQGSEKFTDQTSQVRLEDVMWLLYWCGLGVSAAFLGFVGECMAWRIKQLLNPDGKKPCMEPQ